MSLFFTKKFFKSAAYWVVCEHFKNFFRGKETIDGRSYPQGERLRSISHKEDQMKHINWKILLENSHNRVDLAEEMLAMLVVDLPQTQIAINEAYSNSQWDRLKNKIHLIHGSSNWCSLGHLKSLSATLETLLETSDELSAKPNAQIEQLLAEINEEIQIVLKIIESRSYLKNVAS